jgi:hypothetical protein
MGEWREFSRPSNIVRNPCQRLHVWCPRHTKSMCARVRRARANASAMVKRVCIQLTLPEVYTVWSVPSVIVTVYAAWVTPRLVSFPPKLVTHDS